MQTVKRALSVAALVALALLLLFFAGGFVDQVIQSDRPFLFGLRQSGAFALMMMMIPGLACALLAGLMVLVLAGAIKLDPDTAGYVIALGLSVGALVGIYTIFIAPLVGTAVIIYPLMAMVITVLADRVFSWCRQKSAKRRSPSPA